MKNLLSFLFWSAIFAVLFLAGDQILLRVPLNAPVIHETQVFYRDFRQRLLALPQAVKKHSPAVPATKAPKTPPAAAPRPPETAPAPVSLPAKKIPAAPPPAPPVGKPPMKTATKAPAPAPAPVRYVYADEQGNLQFADSLDEVPAKQRREAKRLDH
jgi:hypothetical protein